MGFRSDLYGSVPGIGTAQETFENHFRWGRDYAGLIVGAQLDGSARDAGNSPTTVLRPGLLLGQITSSGNLKEYNPNGTDGSDQVVGVLLSGFRMQDNDGNNTNRFVWILAGGPVKNANLFLLDEQARAQMAARFVFDDRNYVGNKSPFVRYIAKTADYTVLAADTGTLFTNTGASGAVNFTLPTTIRKGFDCTFFATANNNLTVTAASGKLVAFNNAAATSVSLQTSGNKIGSGFRIVADDTQAKYIALPIGAGTVTVA